MPTPTLLTWKIKLSNAWLALKHNIEKSNESPSQDKTKWERGAETQMLAYFGTRIKKCMTGADEMITDNTYAKQMSGQKLNVIELLTQETGTLRLEIEKLQQQLSEKTETGKSKDAEISKLQNGKSTLKQEVERLQEAKKKVDGECAQLGNKCAQLELSSGRDRLAHEEQVTRLEQAAEKRKKEIASLQEQLADISNPETTLSVMLTQPNVEVLRQVVADMISNTQTLKASVEKYMWTTVKAPEREEILASIKQIMHYQTSCKWRDGWIWNAETWASAMVLWNSIKEILKTYHQYWTQYHATRDEFHGFKLLRECQTCMDDLLKYQKICTNESTNEKSWTEKLKQLVGLKPKGVQMQMLLDDLENVAVYGDGAARLTAKLEALRNLA
jgi:predicted  nucleic acid-binding Zn-ribbon protein